MIPPRLLHHRALFRTKVYRLVHYERRVQAPASKVTTLALCAEETEISAVNKPLAQMMILAAEEARD